MTGTLWKEIKIVDYEDYKTDPHTTVALPEYGVARFLETDMFVYQKEEVDGLNIWDSVDITVRVGPRGGIQFIHVDASHCINDWTDGVPKKLLYHKWTRILSQDGPSKVGESWIVWPVVYDFRPVGHRLDSMTCYRDLVYEMATTLTDIHDHYIVWNYIDGNGLLTTWVKSTMNEYPGSVVGWVDMDEDRVAFDETDNPDTSGMTGTGNNTGYY